LGLQPRIEKCLIVKGVLKSIIVSSGYGDAQVGSRLGTDNIADLISKPYGSDQLRDVLKRVLEDKVATV
jgi:FixJ family two-component response regulator